ncbi:Trigger factor [Buchnera aphidicola (Eriosoma lanigerum)]|uniref:trigger factor n=1 Tax=Buchnera aphidicola TaxID=9 RepID=UPI003464A913
MHVVTTPQQTCNNCIEITISSEIIKKQIAIELKKTRNEIKINGFRKGKIPISIIKQDYLDTIEKNVINHLMQYYFLKFIKEKNINIIGKPTYNIRQYQPEKILIYSIYFEKYPKFDLKYPKKKEIKQLSIQITENDIKQTIQNIHNKQKKIWIKVNRAIKNKDLITINYQLLIKNKILHKYTKKNFQFIIGNNSILPTIEQSILNKKIGDYIELYIMFPINHCDQEIQGKKIHTQIYIKNIEELNYQKYQKNNIIINKNKYQSFNDQYKIIKNKINIEVEKIKKNYLKNQIISKLLKENLINIPNQLLMETITNLQNENIKIYKEQGEPVLSLHINNQNFQKKAIEIITIQLLLKKIIDINHINIDEKVYNILNTNLESKSNNEKKIKKLYSNIHFIKSIKNMIFEETAYELLLKQFNLIKLKCNFQEALIHIQNV